jgi:TPR repeat protein
MVFQNSKSLISKMIAIAITGLLPSMAVAYPLVSNECKPDPVKCAKDGHLDGIEIYGKIGYSDYDLFNKVNAAIAPDATFPKIYLDSPGGSILAAIEIGKILRTRKATVISGSPYMAETHFLCGSACIFVAAGATKRQLSHIGFHSAYWNTFSGPRNWTSTDLKKDEMKEDFLYLDQMGIDPEVKNIIENTPSKEVVEYYFNSAEPWASQKIVQLGFRMLQDVPTPEMKLPVRDDEVGAALYAQYVNAIKYGNNEAISDYVIEILKTPPGEEIDYEEANRWLQIGADRGDPNSLHSLAFHLQKGLGTEKNVDLAVKYYLRAAQLGFAPSQNNVGWHYYQGDGVVRRIPEAVFWITRSADQGEPFAYGSLCEIYDAGDAFEANDIEAYKWCWLAVEHEPAGRVRENDRSILQKFMAKLSGDALKKAQKLAETWTPLRDSGRHMSDPDDG